MLCHQDDSEPLPAADSRGGEADPRAFLHRCTNCGLIFTAPSPLPRICATLSPLETTPFPPSAFRHRVVDFFCRMEYWRRFESDQLLRVIPFLGAALFLFLPPRWRQTVPYQHRPGRLLGVGEGLLDRLTAGAAQGWEATWVDPSLDPTLRGCGECPPSLVPGPLTEARLPSRHYDAALIAKVLERCPDPRNTLIELRRVVKDTGHLIVETPNFSRMETALWRSDWSAYAPDLHHYHFQRETLTRLLEECGWRVVNAGFPMDTALWGRSWRARRQRIGRSGSGDGLDRLTAAEIALFAVPALLASAVRQSGRLILYCRKAGLRTLPVEAPMWAAATEAR